MGLATDHHVSASITWTCLRRCRRATPIFPLRGVASESPSGLGSREKRNSRHQVEQQSAHRLHYHNLYVSNVGFSLRTLRLSLSFFEISNMSQCDKEATLERMRTFRIAT